MGASGSLSPNDVTNEREYRSGLPVLKSFPTWLQLEPTVVCNLHCAMCRGQAQNLRPGRVTDRDLYRRVCGSGWFHHLRLIEINGWGETFLHPQTGWFLERCAASDGLQVQITTNGLLLGKEQLLATLCRMPRLRLVFSIDSPDPEVYRLIRRGGSLRRLTGNLERLNQLRCASGSSLALECHCLVHRLNLDRLCAMVDFAVRQGFERLLFTRMHSCPELEVPDRLAVPALRQATDYAAKGSLVCSGYHQYTPRPKASRPTTRGRVWRCPRPWKHVHVRSDGEVTPCCYLTHPDSDAVMGNLTLEPFERIWNSDKYQTLRRSAFCGYPSFCRDVFGGCAAKNSFEPNVRLPAAE